MPLNHLMQQAIAAVGESEVENALVRLCQTAGNHTLTIISNAGMHSIPREFVHGEEYIASQGNLDLSTAEAIARSYKSMLKLLAAKLREKAWTRIHLVLTGPPTLAAQIKLLVYHVTRLSTVDLYYSHGQYAELDLDYRKYLLASDGHGVAE